MSENEQSSKDSKIRSLYSDHNRYLESFQAFLRDSDEHEAMVGWIKEYIAELVQHFGGKKEIRLLSVGCGEGQVDLVIIEKIREAFEQVHVTLLDPSDVQIQMCKTLLQSTTNENGSEGKGTVKLDFKVISFEEFVASNQASGGEIPKYDVIYLVQMLYYVKDPFTVLENAVEYLGDSGKLFLIHVSGNSGYAKVWRKFGDRLPHDDNCNYTTADDIKKLCDRLEPRVAVTMTEIESRFIIDGNLATTAKGQLAVDFIVEAAHFVEKAPEPLKSEVLQLIESSECTTKNEKNEVCFNNNLSAITMFKR